MPPSQAFHIPGFSDRAAEYAARLAEPSAQIGADLKLTAAELCEGIALFAGIQAIANARPGQVHAVIATIQLALQQIIDRYPVRPPAQS